MIRQIEAGALVGAAAQIRTLAQRVRVAGLTTDVRHDADCLRWGLLEIYSARANWTETDGKVTCRQADPADLPERTRVGCDAISAASDTLAQIAGGKPEPAPAAMRMQEAAELLERAEGLPLLLIPPDSDRLRDALQDVLACAASTLTFWPCAPVPLPAETAAHMADRLTRFAAALDAAGAALESLEPETRRRLDASAGEGWRDRLRAALDAIAKPLAGAMPGRTSKGKAYPADPTNLVGAPRPNWDPARATLAQCQDDLFALRQTMTPAKPAEPTVETPAPVAGEPKGGTAATAEASESKIDEPDEKGFVANPSDPTAYVLLTEIVRKHALEDWATGRDKEDREKSTLKRVRLWLENHPQIRRYTTRKGQRNHIHLTDWLAHLPGKPEPAAAQPDPTPDDIERRKQAIRAAKS